MTDQHIIDNMSEEEFYEYRRNIAKEFTEEDYLSCSITRERLQNEFIWEWEKNGVPKIENYYNGMRRQNHETFATPLFYDKDGSFSSELTGIVYTHLKKEYDLSIFHNCPKLADPLIKQYEEIQQKKKDLLKQKRKMGGVISDKKFDWGAKTHK
jgi:hypothetical protein|tara:strand:+ start:885 stop:1346 length:462 start_codon:yes stop_codon:yes gene_type:complete